MTAEVIIDSTTSFSLHVGGLRCAAFTVPSNSPTADFVKSSKHVPPNHINTNLGNQTKSLKTERQATFFSFFFCLPLLGSCNNPTVVERVPTLNALSSRCRRKKFTQLSSLSQVSSLCFIYCFRMLYMWNTSHVMWDINIYIRFVYIYIFFCFFCAFVCCQRSVHSRHTFSSVQHLWPLQRRSLTLWINIHIFNTRKYPASKNLPSDTLLTSTKCTWMHQTGTCYAVKAIHFWFGYHSWNACSNFNFTFNL